MERSTALKAVCSGDGRKRNSSGPELNLHARSVPDYACDTHFVFVEDCSHRPGRRVIRVDCGRPGTSPVQCPLSLPGWHRQHHHAVRYLSPRPALLLAPGEKRTTHRRDPQRSRSDGWLFKNLQSPDRAKRETRRSANPTRPADESAI